MAGKRERKEDFEVNEVAHPSIDANYRSLIPERYFCSEMSLFSLALKHQHNYSRRQIKVPVPYS